MGQLAVAGAPCLDPGFFERFRRRDPEVIGILFDLLAPRVHVFMAHVVADPDELDRLVEEVLWTVWVAPVRPAAAGDVDRLLRHAMGSCLRRRTAERAQPGVTGR